MYIPLAQNFENMSTVVLSLGKKRHACQAHADLTRAVNALKGNFAALVGAHVTPQFDGPTAECAPDDDIFRSPLGSCGVKCRHTRRIIG